MFWRTLYDGIMEADDTFLDPPDTTASTWRGRVNTGLEPTGELAHRQTERLVRLVSLALLELPGVPPGALARERDHRDFAAALHDELLRLCRGDPELFNREIGDAENLAQGHGKWLENLMTPTLWRKLSKSAA